MGVTGENVDLSWLLGFPSSLDLALQHLLSAPDPEEPLNKHVLQHQLGLTVILFYLLCRQNTVETPVGVKTGEVS